MMPLEKLFEKIRHDITKTFKQNLISLMVIGSAAIDDHQPGLSDINFLVVLHEIGLDQIDQLRKVFKSYQKHGAAMPLLMTLSDINDLNSLSPIECLEIKEKHRVLQGEDFFAKMNIDAEKLQPFFERAIQTSKQQIRNAYFKNGDQVKQLKNVILESHRAFFPLFRTALRLSQVEPPLKKDEVIQAVSQTFELNKEIFLKIKLLKQGELKITIPMLKTLFSDYLLEVDKMIAALK